MKIVTKIIAFGAMMFLPVAAHADPLTGAVVAAIGLTGQVATVASWALGTALSFGLSYVPARRR